MQLKVSGIQKAYGKKQVLKDISFTLSAGECIAFLGGNGCGKSTLLSVLAGVTNADSGEVLVDGKKDFSAIGYIPQGNPLMEELTAEDNLRLWYDKISMQKELQDGVLKLLGIGEFLKVPVRKLSGGMKKRLSIGCQVAGNPGILLMDEPTAALDLACKDRIYGYMSRFLNKGGAILLVTHDIHEIELCDRCYLIRDGKNIEYKKDGDLHKLAGMME